MLHLEAEPIARPKSQNFGEPQCQLGRHRRSFGKEVAQPFHADTEAFGQRRSRQAQFRENILPQHFAGVGRRLVAKVDILKNRIGR